MVLSRGGCQRSEMWDSGHSFALMLWDTGKCPRESGEKPGASERLHHSPLKLTPHVWADLNSKSFRIETKTPLDPTHDPGCPDTEVHLVMSDM